MPRRELLSDGQREDLLALPADEAEFIRRYSLAAEDLTRIGRFNKPHNRLGFAVLLCYLRYPGQELGPGAKPDGRLLSLVAGQVGVSLEAWPDYIRRDENRREHLAAIKAAYGYRSFSGPDYRALAAWLLPVAMQTDQGLTLVRSALEELRGRKVILPRLPVVERLCAETSARARRRIYRMLAEPLSPSQRSALDGLLVPSSKGNLSVAAWLRQPTAGSGPRHFLELMDRLKRVRDSEPAVRSGGRTSPKPTVETRPHRSPDHRAAPSPVRREPALGAVGRVDVGHWGDARRPVPVLARPDHE